MIFTVSCSTETAVSDFPSLLHAVNKSTKIRVKYMTILVLIEFGFFGFFIVFPIRVFLSQKANGPDCVFVGHTNFVNGRKRAFMTASYFSVTILTN